MNTHAAFKRLTNSGLGEKIAEVVIEIVDETRRSDFEQLVTKEYLNSENILLGTELKEEISTIRTEIKERILAVRADLKGEISAVRTDLGMELASIRADHKEAVARLIGDISLLKWMVGISITLSLAIVAKIFFI